MYDYRYEPHRLIFMIDNKSFFASCEALRLGLNPMEACLAVVSRQPDSCWGSGLIMAASPLAKMVCIMSCVFASCHLNGKLPI